MGGTGGRRNEGQTSIHDRWYHILSKLSINKWVLVLRDWALRMGWKRSGGMSAPLTTPAPLSTGTSQGLLANADPVNLDH
jgi:hypothetical protein